MNRIHDGRLAVLGLAMVATTAVLAQVPPPHTGHEGHMAMSPASAVTSVMDHQPSLEGVELVDQHGRPVSLTEAVGDDRPVMVNFIFTTCTTICPVMSAGFSQLQKVLGDERDAIHLVSISIDPEADTPAALRVYAERYQASESWVFLTGTREASIAAQRAFGAYRGDKTNHSPTTYVRRTAGGVWEKLDGLSSGETLLAAYRGSSTHHHQ